MSENTILQIDATIAINNNQEYTIDSNIVNNYDTLCFRIEGEIDVEA